MGCLISKSLLQVCSAPPAGVPGGGAPCPAGTLLTLNAPFVLVATGKNASAAAIGLDEQHNLDADMFFVSHIASATAGNEFAHQVTWGSLPILNAKLVAVGKLP